MIVLCGVSPQYFLDEMSQSELSSILQSKFEERKIAWKQIRTLAFYTMVAEHGTKYIKTPEDLFKFEWDKKKEPIKRTQSLEEIKAFADKLIKQEYGK